MLEELSSALQHYFEKFGEPFPTEHYMSMDPSKLAQKIRGYIKRGEPFREKAPKDINY